MNIRTLLFYMSTVACVAMNSLAVEEGTLFSYALHTPSAKISEPKYAVSSSNLNDAKTILEAFKNTSVESLALSATPTLREVLAKALEKMVIDGKECVWRQSPGSRINTQMCDKVLRFKHPPDTRIETLIPQILGQLGAKHFAVRFTPGRLGNPKDWAFHALDVELY